jgi:hypothetical protein
MRLKGSCEFSDVQQKNMISIKRVCDQRVNLEVKLEGRES